MLRITELLSGGVRIESLDSQSPNVLLFLNGDGKRGEGVIKGKERCVTQTLFQPPTLTCWWPSPMASSQSSLSLAPRVGLAVVPNAYSPARPLTLHFSAGVFPSSLAAVFCLLSYKPNRSTALGCPYSDHFYHNLYVLNYKNDLCSFC